MHRSKVLPLFWLEAIYLPGWVIPAEEEEASQRCQMHAPEYGLSMTDMPANETKLEIVAGWVFLVRVQTWFN